MSGPEFPRAEGVAPPMGHYSHAVRHGGLLFVAGQLSLDEAGELVGPGDLEGQVRQVYRNLGAVLASGGSSFANVLRFTTYLVRAADVPAFRSVREAVFAELFPDGRYPANTLLVVDRLAREEYLVEIEAVAAVDEPGASGSGG